MLTVAAQPYAYAFEPSSTALVVIDMQRDFIERGGFGETLGNDVSRLATIVPTVAALLDWGRGLGLRRSCARFVAHGQRVAGSRGRRGAWGGPGPRIRRGAPGGRCVLGRAGRGSA